MNSVQIKHRRTDEGTSVAIVGDFTEHADFSAVLAVATQGSLIVFDLVGVRRVNSCGVREWIRLMEALRVAGVNLAFERCSVAFVNQMNMIVNFGGSARVRSFYVPYLCPSCNTEHTELCEVPESHLPSLSETASCPNCQGTSEFDDMRDLYLSFLTSGTR